MDATTTYVVDEIAIAGFDCHRLHEYTTQAREKHVEKLYDFFFAVFDFKVNFYRKILSIEVRVEDLYICLKPRSQLSTFIS